MNAFCLPGPARRLGVPSPHHRQKGLTLVELMIAVAISLFMMLAFVGIFINMKRTFTTQDQLSQMQDSERLALTMIISTVQSAGYFPNPAANTQAGLLPAIAAVSGVNPAMVDGQRLAGLDGASNGTDTLTVRHAAAPNDDVTDCFGRRNGTTGTVAVTNTFAVNTTTNELTCRVGTVTNVLVSNVKKLAVEYLIEVPTGLRYVVATSVTDWTKVRSVRVVLTLLNPIDPSLDIVWTQNISLMNGAN